MTARPLGFAIVLGLLGACGGPSERHCGGESGWSGTCTLKSVTKLREVEMPVPHAVIQAIYEPQSSPQSANYTPPSVPKEFQVYANQEDELRTWLEANQNVSCQMTAPPPGSCTPGEMAVNLPPFTPTGQTAASEVHGCAQIESSSTQDQLPSMTQNAEQLPQVFLFEQSSSEPTGEIIQAVDEVGKKLAADTNIECVAVVGQISPNEQPQVADQRARTIRGLLQGRESTLRVSP